METHLSLPSVEKEGGGHDSHGDGFSRQLPALSSLGVKSRGQDQKRGDRKPGACVYAEPWTIKLFFIVSPKQV